MPMTLQVMGGEVMRGDCAAFDGSEHRGVVHHRIGREQFVAAVVIEEPACRIDVESARPGIGRKQRPVDLKQVGMRRGESPGSLSG